MLRSLVVFLTIWIHAAAQCPGSGLSAHDRCWYLSETGATCAATCAAQGLGYSLFVADEGTPMIPQLLGRSPNTKQFSWARTECYVPDSNRYHTAKSVADSNAGDNGDPGDWRIDVCRLACPCTATGGGAPPQEYPACIQSNVVLRHAGAHAIFTDLSEHASMGCWQNDCKNTDKFNAADKGICARVCSETSECTHWSFGEQDGATKCFLRKSDAGREHADGFWSAPKGCAPPDLNAASVALKAADLLTVCDAGKSDMCPDMARAVNTWKFAIKHLKKATAGQVDGNTVQFINQIASDTDAFAAQMSEENFPVVAGNNRQVFLALGGWMAAQPQHEINPADVSLPDPLRGKLCGPTSCYEFV